MREGGAEERGGRAETMSIGFIGGSFLRGERDLDVAEGGGVGDEGVGEVREGGGGEFGGGGGGGGYGDGEGAVLGGQGDG